MGTYNKTRHKGIRPRVNEKQLTMHIIGGKLKGKKLARCKCKSIRPAMALIRKSLFDTLENLNATKDANVLDLYAGSGILGIEALSRGAESLFLIDSDKASTNLIIKNLKLCNLKAKVILGELPKVLKRLTDKKGGFNLIFIDPPYGQSKFIEKVLDLLVERKLIERNGFISIETEAKSSFLFPKELKLFKEKKFGNTRITILQCII